MAQPHVCITISYLETQPTAWRFYREHWQSRRLTCVCLKIFASLPRVLDSEDGILKITQTSPNSISVLLFSLLRCVSAYANYPSLLKYNWREIRFISIAVLTISNVISSVCDIHSVRMVYWPCFMDRLVFFIPVLRRNPAGSSIYYLQRLKVRHEV